MDSEDKEEQFRSKYAMYFNANSNPIIMYDAHIDKIEVHGNLYTQLREGLGKENAPQTQQEEDSDSDEDDSAHEKAVERALHVLAKEIPYSRNYKWGYGFQAMVRKGLIQSGTTNIKFAKMVEKTTGVKASTVRRLGEYFVYSPKAKPMIDKLVSLLDKAERL